jgi:hypothetical protein
LANPDLPQAVPACGLGKFLILNVWRPAVPFLYNRPKIRGNLKNIGNPFSSEPEISAVQLPVPVKISRPMTFLPKEH